MIEKEHADCAQRVSDRHRHIAIFLQHRHEVGERRLPTNPPRRSAAPSPPGRYVAKRLLAQSGYTGQPIVTMAAQDVANQKAWGDVTADLLACLGIKVDFAAQDWGAVLARRTQKSPPAQGGWHIYHTGYAGVDCLDPTNKFIRAHGDKAAFGWPDIPQVEAEVAAWYDATTLAEEKAIARRLNKAALDNAIYAPLGHYQAHYAWRKNVAGIVPGPAPFFWGVSKTV